MKVRIMDVACDAERVRGSYVPVDGGSKINFSTKYTDYIKEFVDVFDINELVDCVVEAERPRPDMPPVFSLDKVLRDYTMARMRRFVESNLFYDPDEEFGWGFCPGEMTVVDLDWNDKRNR